MNLDRNSYYKDDLNLGNHKLKSRLILGSGKYRNIKEACESIVQSECNMVTVAIRRAQYRKNDENSSLVNSLDWNQILLLPNTAGCQTAEDAIKIALLGREMSMKLGQHHNFCVKLEVIPDPDYLLPDPLGTLKAAEYLVSKGLHVFPYINSDPVLAKQLEEIGCSTVMPLGSPIGSGKGLDNKINLQIIINNAKIPVIVDAGIGSASEAAEAMELGASAVIVNSAIAYAKNPHIMAEAMKKAVLAGRLCYLAGRMKAQEKAIASSPSIGILK
uniref:Thiazole synthase n=1 Tax=Porphyridium purpureum TaxID=35688 RepID=W0RZ27_PORPP|nr:thiazole biosynthesis protein ThiG [Porphyridium purpureum]ATJ02923.1 thiazole biosynthesis protein ThiG [Porphyridium purpureum]BAO23702.1 thiazole biosynthesis protein ThiG [Porphyridium purpureum]